MGWLSGWTYRIEIKINHDLIDATLTDFPARVDLPVGDFDFSDARSDGYDIRFTSSDGETLLKYERERHDSTNELARYWVKIPSVSSSADTTFYMYYGKADATDGADPENVWDSDFLAVYHFAQDPTGTVYDSTSNNRDLNDNSGTLTSGDLVDEGGGYAIFLDNEFLKTQDHDWSIVNSAFTVEALSRNTKITAAWENKVGIGVDSAGQTLVLQIRNIDNRYSVGIHSDTEESELPLDIGGDYEYSTTYYNGTTVYVQVERTESSVTNNVSLSVPTSSKLNVGSLSGYYSEVRVSKIVRSYAWRKATAYSLHGELFVPNAVMTSWLSGFDYRKKITIDKDKIHTPLQNFPVVVDLTSANFDFSKARSDGYDIRFTASDGTTLLYYERERHDSANELARYHVLVPSIGIANDTDIYIYYGKSDASDGENATSVWDSDFVAVYHFAQNPTGTVYDSTSNGRNLTAVVSMSSDDLVTHGGGYAIDIANGQSLRTGNHDWSILNSGHTGEFFVNLDPSPDVWAKGCLVGQVGTSGSLPVLVRYSSSSKYSLGVWNDDVATSVDYTTGSYIYFASYQTTYGKDIGGQEDSFVFKIINITATVNAGTNTKLSIGASTTNEQHWPGKYVEFRISKITRSRSWRTATYYSFNGELLSLGSEEESESGEFSVSLASESDVSAGLSVDYCFSVSVDGETDVSAILSIPSAWFSCSSVSETSASTTLSINRGFVTSFLTESDVSAALSVIRMLSINMDSETEILVDLWVGNARKETVEIESSLCFSIEKKSSLCLVKEIESSLATRVEFESSLCLSVEKQSSLATQIELESRLF